MNTCARIHTIRYTSGDRDLEKKKKNLILVSQRLRDVVVVASRERDHITHYTPCGKARVPNSQVHFLVVIIIIIITEVCT